MKKIIVILVVCVVFAASVWNYPAAQAQTTEPIIPTFGLFCKDLNVIQGGSVTFDITDTEMLAHGTGIKKSEYRVSSNNGETEFVVPFVSSALNTPSVNVTVNGQSVKGAVWYGDGILLQENGFDIENVYSPVLDECMTGTLYTVVPNSDTVEITLMFTEQSGFIYETTNNTSSVYSAEGGYAWTLRNALSKPYLRFFILGDCSEHTFFCSCEYKAENFSYKEFIDAQYADCSEYYEDAGGVAVEFFYSLANKILKSCVNINYDELFYYSVNAYRFNAYKFNVSLKNDSVVYYELPISVYPNYGYTPTIYCVEHKQILNYLTSYVVELNEETPYIIKSSLGVTQEGTRFCADSSNGFAFAFGSSKKPTKVSANSLDDKVRVTLLIICITAGCTALACIVLFVFFSIRQNKSNR